MKNTGAQKFFNHIGNSYEDVTSSVGYTLFDFTKALYDKYKIDDGAILDAGCGTGKLKLILGDSFLYTGVDFSESMLSIAHGRGYTTIQGYLEDVLSDFQDKSYDHVVCLSVLYFIKDPKFILKKLEGIARKSLVVSFEKYTKDQLELVFDGFNEVKRYNHSSTLIENPTEVLKNVLFWTYTNKEEIYGDFVFKKIQ